MACSKKYFCYDYAKELSSLWLENAKELSSLWLKNAYEMTWL